MIMLTGYGTLNYNYNYAMGIIPSSPFAVGFRVSHHEVSDLFFLTIFSRTYDHFFSRPARSRPDLKIVRLRVKDLRTLSLVVATTHLRSQP